MSLPGGHLKPRPSKKGRMSSLGPWYTIRPPDSSCVAVGGESKSDTCYSLVIGTGRVSRKGGQGLAGEVSGFHSAHVKATDKSRGATQVAAGNSKLNFLTWTKQAVTRAAVQFQSSVPP